MSVGWLVCWLVGFSLIKNKRVTSNSNEQQRRKNRLMKIYCSLILLILLFCCIQSIDSSTSENQHTFSNRAYLEKRNDPSWRVDVANERDYLKVDVSKMQFQKLMQSTDRVCYGVTFDAGSSGTRVYVFRYPCRTMNTFPAVKIDEETPTERNRLPLSSYADRVDEAGKSLDELMNFARSVVPSELQPKTPVFLRATAGMRLLTEIQQNAILDNVRQYFRNSTFYFERDDWATILSGELEGVYGWVALNYLTQSLGRSIEPSETKMALDMGGASTQITFAPNVAPIMNRFVLDLANTQVYNLYTYSFLGYGNDQARIGSIRISPKLNETTFAFPCFHHGYESSVSISGTNYWVIGTGNTTHCSQIIKQYLNITHSHDSSIRGVYLAPIPQNMEIYGFAGYHIGTSVLGIKEKTTAKQIMDLTIHWCSKNFSEIQHILPGNPFDYSYCFMNMYISHLISDAYHIPEDKQINIVNSFGSLTVSWALGSIINDVSQISCSIDTPGCPASFSPPLAQYSIWTIILLVFTTIIFNHFHKLS